ncbi:MAG: SDR family oxidoreductase [Bacteroidaceae bacterium]|jgi:NAD(P)-dependent dehydrogenase (short-subunit alcohol dehydrogenase family)|nr:SDR family oxidoreductase [Bacteroidaceae bacterium]
MKREEFSPSSEGVRRGLAIITGAGTGMGFEEAKAVAGKGFHTIMACHHPDKAEEKRQEIIQETGNEHVEVMGLDLADLSSVRRFADEIKARFEHLDLLMNNAGTLETGLHKTVDNLERTVQVNYVGPFLLTRLMLPLMGEGSRIVNMVSLTYKYGSLDFPDFFTRGRKGSFWRIPIYSNSKLALTLFTLNLAERLKDKGITVNASDPWIVSTNIIRMHNFIDPLTDIFFRPFIRTPRQGADTAIHLLLDEDKAGQTGTFNRSNRIIDVGDKYLHHKQMQELWDRTEDIVKKFL